ncbi:MAG: HlyD family efflux transporter periplasmic adaptor subunit [Betaproteobacteria bacterium]|jgi:hypothetical protein
MSEPIDLDSSPSEPRPNLGAVFDLINKAQQSNSSSELYFLLVNLTKQLVSYRQAILYREGKGFVAASGLSELDENAPMLIWLKTFINYLHNNHFSGQIDFSSLPKQWADGYQQWFVPGVLIVPIQANRELGYSYLLLFRAESFGKEEIAAMDFWLNSWILSLRILEETRHQNNEGLFGRASESLLQLRERTPSQLASICKRLKKFLYDFVAGGYKKLFSVSAYHHQWIKFKQRFVSDKSFRWKMIIFLLIFVPVRLTIIAPGEIVANQPVVVRAPIDGVLDRFYVEPNSLVKQGQNLFSYDNAALLAKAEGAKQSYMSAEAEYRQTSIASLADAKQKVNLAILQAKANEKKAEYQYLAGLAQRSVMTAPFDGWAIFDDPADQIGKPIAIGEKIMMLADPDDVAIQAWISLSDMIDIQQGARVKLYLNPNPFGAITGYVKYITYEPVQLPDGQYGYRLRASIPKSESSPRLGLKGTLKVSGAYVPAIYWVLRKPLAQIRQFIGI